MGILNYSTSVTAERSIGEITSLLARKQARSITTDFDEHGRLSSISFIMVVGGIPTRFLLPSNAKGVAAVMLRDNPWNTRRRSMPEQYEEEIKAQAVHVAWRILKDWVEAQMALVESGQAAAAQVFMPYATASNGQTMYELFVESNQRQLGSGGE